MKLCIVQQQVKEDIEECQGEWRRALWLDPFRFVIPFRHFVEYTNRREAPLENEPTPYVFLKVLSRLRFSSYRKPETRKIPLLISVE